MVFIHELALGTSFENLLVEVYELLGVDAVAKARDPVYLAKVVDPTGYVTLVYRNSSNCRPSNVKKGKSYLISGTH